MSRRIQKSQAATFERLIVSGQLPKSGRRRGDRVALFGGLILVWAIGSVAVGYWLGEPYLKGRGADPDQATTRLLADSREAGAAESGSAISTSSDSLLGRRVKLLENRIADAVLRIDEIRSDVVTSAFEVEARSEMASLREMAAKSNRELERVNRQLGLLGEQTARNEASVDNAVSVSEAAVAAVAEFGQRAENATVGELAGELRTTRRWAMGGVALAVGSNLMCLGLFVMWRRSSARAQSRQATTDAVVEEASADAARVEAEPRPVSQAKRETAAMIPTAAGQRSGTADRARAGDVDSVSVMVAEMRRASLAGMDTHDSGGPTLRIVEGERRGTGDHVAGDLDVAAENRHGMRFAIHLSDAERADMGARSEFENTTVESTSGLRNVA